MNGRHVHRGLTLVLSLAMGAIGIGLIVEALVYGNPVAALLGVLFIVAGAARLYLEARRQRGA